MWTTAGRLRRADGAIPLWWWDFAAILVLRACGRLCGNLKSVRYERLFAAAASGRATLEPVASAPLAPSARRRSTPACAVDARSYARRRFLHTCPALDRGRRSHPERPLADGLRRVVLDDPGTCAGGRRARGGRAERVHAGLDRRALRRSRAPR